MPEENLARFTALADRLTARLGAATKTIESDAKAYEYWHKLTQDWRAFKWRICLTATAWLLGNIGMVTAAIYFFPGIAFMIITVQAGVQISYFSKEPYRPIPFWSDGERLLKKLKKSASYQPLSAVNYETPLSLNW